MSRGPARKTTDIANSIGTTNEWMEDRIQIFAWNNELPDCDTRGPGHLPQEKNLKKNINLHKIQKNKQLTFNLAEIHKKLNKLVGGDVVHTAIVAESWNIANNRRMQQFLNYYSQKDDQVNS